MKMTGIYQVQLKYIIWLKNKTDVEASISLCKGTSYTFTGKYNSSSQQAYNGHSAKIGYYYDFDDDADHVKAEQKNLAKKNVAIHEF